MTERNKSGLFTKIITVILLAVMLYCLFVIGEYFWNSYQNKKLNDELQNAYKTDEIIEGEQEGNRARFEPLLEINSDVVGWVKIEDTKLDYPVMQAKDNNYYLRRNIHKEYALAGSIFMDYRNQRNGSDKNIIIYGHHMKDGSMFKALMDYKEEGFYQEHPLIKYDTIEESTKWQIFSMYITDTEFDYIRTDFDSHEKYEDFLKEIQNRSLYDTGVQVSKEDKILTLSTCTYEFDDARFTVHAKLIQ